MMLFEEYQHANWRTANVTGPVRASGGTYGGGSESVVVEKVTYSIGHDERSSQFTENVTDPLTASDYKQPTIVNQKYLVRRLTPLECERLQGLPDGYTLIDDKTCSDSARYRALGNGMAQPCADYIIRRIVETVESEEKQ